MAYEIVQLAADGEIFEGWKEVTVTAAINQATRTFDLEVTEIGPWGANTYPPFHFPPGTRVDLYATGSLLTKGYILEYQPSADAESHGVSLNGVGEGYQFVNSSPDHETGQFENKTIEQIAQELGLPFDVTVKSSPEAAQAAAEKVPWFRIRRGSTPWAEMMRLLPQRGLTMSGQADGSIEITKASQQEHAGALIQGQNIKSMSANLSIASRFKETVVPGQSSLGTEDEDFEALGKAEDEEMPIKSRRERPSTAEGKQDAVQKHAEYLRDRSTGRSTQATITTPSFRDKAGELWTPNRLIHVAAPFLKLDETMLIERVVFHQDDTGGTTATLTLVQPQAYGGNKVGGGLSGPPWNAFGNNPAGGNGGYSGGGYGGDPYTQG